MYCVVCINSKINIPKTRQRNNCWLRFQFNLNKHRAANRCERDRDTSAIYLAQDHTLHVERKYLVLFSAAVAAYLSDEWARRGGVNMRKGGVENDQRRANGTEEWNTVEIFARKIATAKASKQQWLPFTDTLLTSSDVLFISFLFFAFGKMKMWIFKWFSTGCFAVKLENAFELD